MKKERTFTAIRIVAIVFALLFFGVTIIQFVSSFSYLKNESKVTRLGFAGTYQTSDDDMPKLINFDNMPNTKETNTIIFNGYFDHDIELNEELFFKINYLDVTILRNGVEIYKYGGEDSRPGFYGSAGKVWGRFRVTKKLSTDDKITVVLKSNYFDNYKSAYSDFFELYTGSYNDIMNMLFLKSAWVFVGALLLLLIGFMLLIAYLLLSLWSTGVHISFLPASGLIICGSLWILCNDDFIIARVNNGIFLNFLPTILLMLMTLCLTSYWMYWLKNKHWHNIAKIMRSIVACVAAIFCLSQLFGLIDPYHVRNSFNIFFIPVLILGMIILGMEIRSATKKIERLSFYYLIIFCIASLAELLNIPLEIFPTNRVLYVGGLIFLVMQAIVSIDMLHSTVQRIQQTANMERELAQNRISIMLSQIQPHFLYNALTAIKGICVTNPKKAEETIVSFSDYLRGNMDSLTAKEPISFKQELTHTKNYLDIEKMRFQHKLNVEYHTPVTDFKLPALTLQPIVENAVRYGVTKKRGGGTVRIKTEETQDSYVVVVRDDGVGFDPMIKKEDGRTHIGISNVQNRLKTMSGGTLEIKSIVNEGTTAIITVPKEEKAIES